MIIVHELDSSSPQQNTAQFRHLPVESWGVGRPVSTGAARAALARAFLHKRATYSGFTCCRRISDIRSALAWCVAQHDIGLTAVRVEKFSPVEYTRISVCSIQLYNSSFSLLINFSFYLSLTKLSTKVGSMVEFLKILQFGSVFILQGRRDDRTITAK